MRTPLPDGGLRESAASLRAAEPPAASSATLAPKADPAQVTGSPGAGSEVQACISRAGKWQEASRSKLGSCRSSKQH